VTRVHLELLRHSRRAGTAEIAANALHEVGNVVNSLNISAEHIKRIVAEQERYAKPGGVAAQTPCAESR
jgi:hypothetical protein